ncbi:Re/Si-specific NAD(P)(+) transhydrogenase subunit alpha [Marispirochaeta sp.]|uniref:Re/Si-specific NAD(P)(+) transhydrogenase subunit alpha n=1 Tax=Marispirochaeta sp. TaxID=2038653 RepID=UPI0029C8CF72|nr:Re/Si-specific NAD(P)(+) transhydrogenase subunit alpha [Marispirochaeta sp.]
MVIAVPKEHESWENRVALTPEGAKKLVDSTSARVLIEKSAGDTAGFSDQDYSAAGAEIMENRQELLQKADILLRLGKPPAGEIPQMKRDAFHISFLDPYNEQELVQSLAARNISAFSMEMIPRSTRAQKMDALSSQASLAGYAAVIEAAREIKMAFPMMMTPAGTISPVRVFVIGAGVAGLQAIATAKRLGARVEAYDTRPVVEEQVVSLGAKFVKIDLGETGQTKDGYARELSPEQLEKQRELMQQCCIAADVVITTAKLFGRKAPLLIPQASIEAMRPGSVIVDMAVDTGGNAELSRPGETVNHKGVQIIGLQNFPGQVAKHASQMYSNNLVNLLLEFWKDGDPKPVFDPADEIIQGALITRDGAVVHPGIRKIYGLED